LLGDEALVPPHLRGRRCRICNKRARKGPGRDQGHRTAEYRSPAEIGHARLPSLFSSRIVANAFELSGPTFPPESGQCEAMIAPSAVLSNGASRAVCSSPSNQPIDYTETLRRAVFPASRSRFSSRYLANRQVPMAFGAATAVDRDL